MEACFQHEINIYLIDFISCNSDFPPAILSLYLAAMTLYSELQVYVLKLQVINSQRQISMKFLYSYMILYDLWCLYDLNKIWIVR